MKKSKWAVALLVLNVSLYSSYFSGAGQDAREELEVVKQQIRNLEADLAELQDELSGYDLEAHNEAYLAKLEADGLGTVSRMSMEIDRRSLMLVAIVRGADDGAVLQAMQIEPTLADDDVAVRDAVQDPGAGTR